MYMFLHTKKNLERYLPDYQHCITTEGKEGAIFTFDFFFYIELELQGDCVLLLSLEFLWDFVEKNMEKGKVTGQNPEIVGSKDQSCAQSIIDGFLCILMHKRRDLKLSSNYVGRGSEVKTLILSPTTF